MFTTTSEHFTTAIKQFYTLIEINTKSVEQLINLQKTFFTAITWEIASQTKTLSTQTDFGKAMNDQKYYSDQIHRKVSKNAKGVYDVATKSSEDVVELVKDSISGCYQVPK
jgi:phasin family protein